MGQGKKKSSSFKWSVKQSLYAAVGVAVLSLIVSTGLTWYLSISRSEQLLELARFESAREFEKAASRFEAQLKTESDTLGLESYQLQEALKRLGATRLTIVSLNGERLKDSGAPDSALTLTTEAVAKITSKAAEYGKASSMLLPNTGLLQYPVLTAAVKFKPIDVSGGVSTDAPVVAIASLLLSEAFIAEQNRGSALSLTKPRVVQTLALRNDSEIHLLKTPDSFLLATGQFNASETSLVLLLLPSAIVAAGLLIAFVLMRSGLIRQKERLNLLRKVADSHTTGKALKLNPSGQVDSIGQLTKSMKQLIDSHHNREKKLRAIAYRDPQTELPNKALYLERLEQLADTATKHNESFSVMVLYIAGLTETMELATPDAQRSLMQDLSSRIVLCVRKGSSENPGDKRENATVARIDDNLFGVLMPNTTVHQAQAFAQAISQNVKHQFTVDDCKVDLAAQVGVVSYPEHCVVGVALHRAAIAAMHDARSSEQSFHIFGNPVRQSRSAKPTAVAKVASKNELFDFDWDKIAS